MASLGLERAPRALCSLVHGQFACHECLFDCQFASRRCEVCEAVLAPNNNQLLVCCGQSENWPTTTDTRGARHVSLGTRQRNLLGKHSCVVGCFDSGQVPLHQTTTLSRHVSRAQKSCLTRGHKMVVLIWHHYHPVCACLYLPTR